eukprot:COSAG05_NODE_183_length_14758_cov_90.142506_1_plen_103_part_10
MQIGITLCNRAVDLIPCTAAWLCLSRRKTLPPLAAQDPATFKRRKEKHSSPLVAASLWPVALHRVDLQCPHLLRQPFSDLFGIPRGSCKIDVFGRVEKLSPPA